MNHRAVKYAERVESGMCVRCGRNPRGKTLRCNKCNRQQMRYLHRSRGKLPEHVAMSVEEIAAALQWPVAEVRFTLMSAIAKVRSQFHDL
jgi:hypothetical protein